MTTTSLLFLSVLTYTISILLFGDTLSLARDVGTLDRNNVESGARVFPLVFRCEADLVPSGSVTFQTLQPATLTVHVDNLLGQRVASLGERAFGIGMQTLSLDGLGLPGGFYFLVLEAPSIRTVRRILWVPGRIQR